jgi:hypothetical protein
LKPVFALAAALALSACGHKQIHVDHGWVRLPAVQGHPAAAYFTLHGGPSDTTLLSVTTPVAIRTEMHQTIEQNGVSTMAPLAQVALPAGGTVKFEPDGKHVMLFSVDPTVKPGDMVALRFVFANNLQIEYDAQALAAGAPAPKD